MAKKLWHNLLRSGKKKYYIRGTSSNIGGTETFNIQYIDDGAVNPSTAETVTCNVDANGDWEFSYTGKKIYSLSNFCRTWATGGGSANSTLLSFDFSGADDFLAVTNAGKAFYWCTSLTSVTFGNRTLENCININGMFARCTTLTNSSINWGSVTFASVTTAHEQFNINDYGMFQGCTALTAVTLPFAFPSLLYCANMFRGCTALTSVSFPNATFASVLDTRNMFYGCTALTDVSTFRNKTFASVTRMNAMFHSCRNISSIDFSSASFANLQSTSEMFYGCSALTSIDLSNKTFSALTSSDGMFRGCNHVTTIDLTSATFGALINTGAMFYGCSAMTSLIWPNADLSTIRTITSGGGNPNGMFRGCSSMTSIPTRNMNWNEIANMGYVFASCSSLTAIDFSSFTFAKLQIANNTFVGCSALTSLNFSSATFALLTRMDAMFKNCSNLSTITWGNNLNLQSLTTIGGYNGNTTIGIFEGCSALTSLNWSGQTLPSVVQLGNAFKNCSSLASVNFSSATFANVTDSDGMFAGCPALTSIDMSVATFEKVARTTRGQNITIMFYNCTNLTTLNVPQNSTAILPTSTAGSAPMDLHWSLSLSYASMLKVANWLSDLTGYTAHTCTFKTDAWGALTQTEKDNIDAILTAKNWTRAIAQ